MHEYLSLLSLPSSIFPGVGTSLGFLAWAINFSSLQSCSPCGLILPLPFPAFAIFPPALGTGAGTGWNAPFSLPLGAIAASSCWFSAGFPFEPFPFPGFPPCACGYCPLPPGPGGAGPAGMPPASTSTAGKGAALIGALICSKASSLTCPFWCNPMSMSRSMLPVPVSAFFESLSVVLPQFLSAL